MKHEGHGKKKEREERVMLCTVFKAKHAIRKWIKVGNVTVNA